MNPDVLPVYQRFLMKRTYACRNLPARGDLVCRAKEVGEVEKKATGNLGCSTKKYGCISPR